MDAGNRATWRTWMFSRWGGFCHDHAGLVALVVLAITIFFGYFVIITGNGYDTPAV